VFVHGRFGAAVGAVFAVAVERGFAEQVGAGAGDDAEAVGFQAGGDGGLVALFRAHGAPLVLEADNASAFIAGLTQKLLADWQVWHLRSPDIPEYSGACEAGIGSMKTRTHNLADRGGRASPWNCDASKECVPCAARRSVR
jgi:hypothetical protein